MQAIVNYAQNNCRAMIGPISPVIAPLRLRREPFRPSHRYRNERANNRRFSIYDSRLPD
jgi:hypothetical protein